MGKKKPFEYIQTIQQLMIIIIMGPRCQFNVFCNFIFPYDLLLTVLYPFEEFLLAITSEFTSFCCRIFCKLSIVQLYATQCTIMFYLTLLLPYNFLETFVLNNILLCVSGYRCSNSSLSQESCPKGTYQDLAGMTSCENVSNRLSANIYKL